MTGARAAQNGTAAVVLSGVTRLYGEVLGVNDISLTLGRGVIGLLGPNGAGKSTLIKLIAGQLKPNRGELRVFGEEAWNNPEVNRRLGLCPEVDAFYSEMTGEEFLCWMIRLCGLERAEAAVLTDQALARAGLAAARHKRIAGYSKGMRQRLKLAQATVLDPELLLLDEPLSGLDPLGRMEVIRWLRKVDREGRHTVLVSSHVLHEVESMTRSIVLVHQGRILAEGDVHQIRALIDSHPHRIHLRVGQPRRVAALLMGFDDVVSVTLKSFADDRGSLEVETVRPDLFYGRLPQLVVEEELDVGGLDSADDNLQAVFDYLVN